MQPTVYQKPEIRDANDNIIQQGAFGKNTALANSTNNGWIDYVANDLEFLYDIAKDEVVPVPSLPASGQMSKTYLLTTTGVSYRWSGTAWVEISSSEAVGRAEAAAQTAATAAKNSQTAAASSASAASSAASTMLNTFINTTFSEFSTQTQNSINAVDERVTTVNTNLSENIQGVSDSLREHLNGLKFSVTGEGKLHVELEEAEENNEE